MKKRYNKYKVHQKIGTLTAREMALWDAAKEDLLEDIINDLSVKSESYRDIPPTQDILTNAVEDLEKKYLKEDVFITEGGYGSSQEKGDIVSSGRNKVFRMKIGGDYVGFNVDYLPKEKYNWFIEVLSSTLLEVEHRAYTCGRKITLKTLHRALGLSGVENDRT